MGYDDFQVNSLSSNERVRLERRWTIPAASPGARPSASDEQHRIGVEHLERFRIVFAPPQVVIKPWSCQRCIPPTGDDITAHPSPRPHFFQNGFADDQ